MREANRLVNQYTEKICLVKKILNIVTPKLWNLRLSLEERLNN